MHEAFSYFKEFVYYSIADTNQGVSERTQLLVNDREWKFYHHLKDVQTFFKDWFVFKITLRQLCCKKRKIFVDNMLLQRTIFWPLYWISRTVSWWSDSCYTFSKLFAVSCWKTNTNKIWTFFLYWFRIFSSYTGSVPKV